MPKVKFTLLGTGTSSGVPMIACHCDTCSSDDKRDVRLRCSLHIQSPNTDVIIDTSSDFRYQCLKYKISRLDAILFTHHHFDHIGGFDDIRAYNYLMQKPLDLYANQSTFVNLKRIFNYAFYTPEQIGGGVPLINPFEIYDDDFFVNDLRITPIPMKHGIIDVLGFRIGNFAYLTDTNYIPPESIEKLFGLEILIIDALRFEKHPTHFNVSESLEMINILKPRQAYLTHIAHQLKHKKTEELLPENVYMSYDGLSFEMDVNDK